MILFTKIWLVLLCSSISSSQEDKNNYGPYKIYWKTFETCKGPKKSDCGKFLIDNAKNMSNVIFKLDFQKDCAVTMARVSISTKQSNSTKKLFNYSLDQPCQHFVLGPILIDVFNPTSNCKINKGKYEAHLNMNEKTLNFLGNNFFYGTYQFKTLAYNNKQNFFCVHTILSTERL